VAGEPFEALAQRIEPESTPLRAWGLKGGVANARLELMWTLGNEAMGEFTRP
jgi:hypothetical protein